MRCKNHVIQIVYVIVFSIFINCCIINDSIVFANDDNQNSEIVRDISTTRSTSSELVQYFSNPETYDLGLGFIGAGLVGQTIFGITVTSGMVIAATGLLFAASLGCTVYSIYNVIKSTRPKEEADGSVIFHMGLEEYIGESFIVNMDSVNMNKSTSYIDLAPYPIDNYVCLGSFPLNTSVLDYEGGYGLKTYPTYVFADLIYYDDLLQTFKADYPTTKNDLICTFTSGFSKGSTVTPTGLSSLKFFTINRYRVADSVPKISHGVITYTTKYDEPYLLQAFKSKIAHESIGTSLRMSYSNSSNFSTIVDEVAKGDFTFQIWVKNTVQSNMRGLVGATVYHTSDPVVNDGEIIIPDDKFKINEDIKVIPPAPEVFTDPEYKIEDMPIENVKVPFPDIPPEYIIKPVPETDPNPEPNPDPDPNPEPNPDPSTPWEWIIKWMTDFWEKLKQLLIDVLKFVFVPDTWEEFVKDLDDTLKDKMPFIDQINDLKDTIHFSGDERLIIPFIRGTYITLPDYFENNRMVFRNMLSAIMHVLFLVGLIKRFIPRFVVTDAGK